MCAPVLSKPTSPPPCRPSITPTLPPPSSYHPCLAQHLSALPLLVTLHPCLASGPEGVAVGSVLGQLDCRGRIVERRVVARWSRCGEVAAIKKTHTTYDFLQGPSAIDLFSFHFLRECMQGSCSCRKGDEITERCLICHQKVPAEQGQAKHEDLGHVVHGVLDRELAIRRVAILGVPRVEDAT